MAYSTFTLKCTMYKHGVIIANVFGNFYILKGFNNNNRPDVSGWNLSEIRQEPRSRFNSWFAFEVKNDSGLRKLSGKNSFNS